MSSRSSKHKEKSSDSAHKEEIQSVNPRWLRPLIIAVAALYAVLHVYGAFEPGALNWGFHFFAFLLPATRVVLALAMLVVLIPSVQERLLGLTEKGVAGYASLTTLRKRIAIVAGLTVAVGIFWIGRETGYFLGDGLLALGNLSSIRRPENIPILLQNAPLSGIITWTFLKFLAAKEFANPETLSFQILSIGTGVICLILFALITRHMTTDRTERVLAFLFIVSTSTAQMFFGYVENYSPALLATVLFIYLTLEHLRGRVHVALPSLAFGLMFASHFGLFYMFPAVLFLYFIAARKRRWVSIGIAVVVMIVGTYAVLSISGYPPHVVKEIFFKEGGTHIVPFKPSNGWHAYTMFSPMYFSERANYYLLLGPFALLIFAVVLPYSLRSISLNHSRWIFLVFMSLFSIAFTCGINFDIGMARDWDLLSPYNVALVVAGAFAWFRYIGDPPMRKKLMIVMVSVTLIHTTSYILVNAQEEPSVERFTMLRDPRIWGPAALIYADEGLGTYYRRLGDNEKALYYYRQGLDIDSLNARRWVAIASVYQALGQKENFRHALEKAVETGTPDIQVYLRLGEDFIREGDVDRGIAIWKKGLSTGPNAVGLSYFIGRTLADQKGDYQQAIGYLVQASQAFPQTPDVLYAVGSCYYHLGKSDEMKAYWGRLLALAPRYPEADNMRKLMGE